jgi:transcriptional regulator with XRE-family HTH domain
MTKTRRRSVAARFPIYLREWREARGLTQLEMAVAIGIGKSSISRIESGANSYSRAVLEGYAVELRCLPSDLISHPPPPSVRPAQQEAFEMLRKLGHEDLIAAIESAAQRGRRRRRG